MSLNKVYAARDNVDLKYWKEIGVKADSINEYDDQTVNNNIQSIFSDSSESEVKDIIELFESNTIEKASISDLLGLHIDRKRLLLFLRDFQNRRKRSIKEYYNDFMKRRENGKIIASSVLAMLLHLYTLSPKYLIELYTLHLWSYKSTGSLYALSKKISEEKTKKIATEIGFQDKLTNDLYKASKETNKYRVFSYAYIEKEKMVILLYKQVNDAPRPDFVEAIRNRDVTHVLFSLDLKNSTFEIKNTTGFESTALKEYIEFTFNALLTPVTEDRFDNYKPDKFMNAFISGESATDEKVEDFLVNRIVFRESLLKNTPELTLSLNNIDIWPSIKDAYERDIINLKSIKDISSLTISTAKTSRVIRSIIQDNGDVIFTMDDSRLSVDQKRIISEKFFKKFGVPLNTPIANDKFVDGRADKVDYVMGQVSMENINSPELEFILDELTTNELLKKSGCKVLSCKNKSCNYEESLDDAVDFPNECPDCDSDIKITEQVFISVNFSNAVTYVKKRLRDFCNNGEWDFKNDSKVTMYKKEFKLINLENQKNDLLQVLVTEETLPRKIINRITKMMTPTLLVFIGKQYSTLETYNSNCILPINFGKLFNIGEQEFYKMFLEIHDNLQIRLKSFMSTAADKAFESLKKSDFLRNVRDIEKDYGAQEFEDDVFAIIKDLFPNAEKWGKELSGKPVPEGIFAVSYRNEVGNRKNEYRRVFSYDCKFTRKETGYDLEKSEQRKAVDYVDRLNNVTLITRFSDISQLSSHIFISNHFNASNIETMVDHFYQTLGEDYNARPIFLPNDVLCHIFSKYRQFYEQVNNSRNIFLENISKLLSTDKTVITKEMVDVVFDDALDEDVSEIRVLNTKKVTTVLKQK